MDNGGIYYTIVLDENTIQLSDFYYEVISSDTEIQIIDITSQSSGSFSAINPELFGAKNSTVIFDLSDPSLTANSLPAFNFYLYSDADLTTEYYTSEGSVGDFDVKTTG